MTNEQSWVVKQLIESGRYRNADRVFSHGRRLIEESEADAAARLESLRAAGKIGIADFDSGQFVSFETAQALVTHLASFAKSAIPIA